MTKTPAYEQITAWLRTEADRRGPGSLMPTIAEVCDRFGVGGVQTVRDGYAPLIEEGVVERRDSPRRWAVVDHGQVSVTGPTHSEMLDELVAALARATELVRELRLAS